MIIDLCNVSEDVSRMLLYIESDELL